MPENTKNSRAVAASILTACDVEKQNVSDFITAAGSVNRAAVTDYVCGVLRNRVLIDAVLEKIAAVRQNRVEKPVFNAIRIAVYEMIYTPLTPMYAIINEAVSQFSSKHKRGFINAVLRSVQRGIELREDANYTENEYFVPVNHSSGCKFAKKVVPDPTKNPVLYLSCAFSMPQWLLEQWSKHYGSQALRQICLASNRIASIHIRPNITLTTAEALHKLFTDAGVDCGLCPNDMLVINSLGRIDNISSLPGFGEGLFCVQDPTAAKVARFINPRPGDVVLDLCAAPGTKTTHIAELMGQTGKVIATDINSSRLQLVRDNVRRLKLTNVEVVEYEDVIAYAARENKIDSMLIDAPCSNTGVLSKRIEARYRITAAGINELTKIQLEILTHFANNIKPCKQVFYSTCSIEPKENTQVLHSFLKKFLDYRKTDDILTLPEYVNAGCDGGYVAKILNNYCN